MSADQIRVFPGVYRDSLVLLSASRAMRDGDGVDWATAAMGTPGAVEDLVERGFPAAELEGADGNALVLAVSAADPDGADAALRRGHDALFARAAATGQQPGRRAARTVGEAVGRLPGANVAIVSTPGPYAAITAHAALSQGLHVLLFSDNVPLEQEIELKERASRLGLLVMGPGAGTSVLGGVGLGFANAVGPGPVGVVAAAGTGAQEVMTLLDRWGVGVSHVVGVGGRDLSSEVGGRMARDAVRALDADPATEVILLVSKPPDPEVAREVVTSSTRTPVVAAALGVAGAGGELAGASLAATLEEGALLALREVGGPEPDLMGGLGDAVTRAAERVPDERVAVRGFFTGGTLCYEAQVVLGTLLGPVHSNIPMVRGRGLPAPDGAHVCLDLGEEEYTRGRPHPMIDPAARREIMESQAFGKDVAVVLLDVVLGYGSHRDPAGEIAATCADIAAEGAAVVTYVLGAHADPQGFDAQRRTLEEAGAIVTATGAQAARAAAAIAARRPALAQPGAV